MADGDLAVLVADQDTEVTIRTLLSKRYGSIGMRQIRFEIIRHPQRDSGCRTHAHDLLRVYLRDYGKALVVFDHHGSGRDDHAPEALEQEVTDKLTQSGWQAANTAVVVIQPELEA